ncbi:low temperature requirement protein A [Actinophytocola sp.]|uniref:low temperature requirement protein A n=1 Tax=Actinophytocola sp. TaxID=1872138 RepID=UPI00389A77CE
MTEPEAEGKRVSWAELFFDLVFVFAITQLAALLHRDHGWGGVGATVVLFLPIYWVWVGTTMQANRRDLDRPTERIAIFFVALCGLVMAFAVPHAYDNRGPLFAAAYWAARLGYGVFAFRGQLRYVQPFSVSIAFTGPLLVVGALFDGPAREILWLAGALIDLAMPSLLRRRLASMHFDAGHLTERFGLFVLIALGESVVAVGAPVANSGEPVGVATLCAAIAAFLLCCALWWVYFHFANDAMRHALTVAPVQLTITRHVLSYGHVVFIAAIVAIAVGMEETVAAPTHRLGWAYLGLLYGGTAMFLATFGYTRWMMFHLVSTTRLAAAAAVLALLSVAWALPALGAILLLAAALVVLNAVELARVRRAARA